MNEPSLAAHALPTEALPFVRELLWEITRRIPPALGGPPRPCAAAPEDPHACREAVADLLRWLDGASDDAGERFAEFEASFGGLTEVAAQLEARLRRTALGARQRLEEEQTFSRTLREVLGPAGDGDAAVADPGPRHELLRRVEAQERATRSEADALSRQFEAARRDLATLRTEIAHLERRTRELRRESLRDGLTGLGNRRAYAQRLADEVVRAERYGLPLSVAVWDVDRLGRVNAAHGPRVGDLVLQGLAGRICALLRRSDFPARRGGGAFAAVLPHTDDDQSLVAGRRIREATAETPLGSPAGPVALTVSVGVASLAPGDTAETLSARADAALRRAKAAGGDRVESAPAPADPLVATS